MHFLKVDTRTRQIEVDVENLDTCRNEDLPPLLKQEAQPGIKENLQKNILWQPEQQRQQQ